jgi:hypothetical protein
MKMLSPPHPVPYSRPAKRFRIMNGLCAGHTNFLLLKAGKDSGMQFFQWRANAEKIHLKFFIMKTISTIFSAAIVLLSVSCMDQEVLPSQKSGLNSPATDNETSMNGRESVRPAYYEGDLFNVNMMELSEEAGEAIIANNEALNEIYAYNDLDDPQDFISIIDAVPGDGMNPLWLQFLIVFNPGFEPHQFTSEEEVEAAAENGEITLVNTEEVYRCSVVK